MAALVLIAALACSGGSSITRRYEDNGGHIEIGLGDVDGSNSQPFEIDADWKWQTFSMNVTLQVDGGAYQMDLYDEQGSRLSLNASAGQPGTGNAGMVTSAEGKINLQGTGQGAKNVKIVIDYSRE